MWLLFRDMVAQAVAVVLMTLGPTASGGPTPEPPPLEYRGDSMQVLTKPNRIHLRGNVVIRRGNLMVCCTSFEGHADPNWGWQRFSCTEKVRALRAGETMWADKAELILETSDLILTGHPLLHRGRSFIEGLRIVVDTKRDRARIERPRGRLHSDREPAAVPPEVPAGELPASCPLPARPQIEP